MDFIVNYDEKKRNLLDKMDSKNLDFTKEEEFLLENDSEVRDHFYTILVQGRNLWNREIRDLFFECLEYSDITQVGEEALCYYCYDEIDSEKIEYFPEMMEYTTKKEKILEYFSEKLKDPNYVPSGEMNGDVASAILKKGRYELFYNFKSTNATIPGDLIEEIVNHFPYHFHKLPVSYMEFINYLNKLAKEEQNVYNMIDYCFDDPEKFLPILKKKIFLENARIDKEFEDSTFLSHFYGLLDNDEQTNFRRKLLEQGNIKTYFKFAPLEEIEQNILFLSKMVKESKVSLGVVPDKLLNNHIFIEALLENPVGRNLEHLYNSPLFSNYRSKLISSLEENEEKYNDLDLNYSLIMILKDYPETFRQLLRRNLWYIDSQTYSGLKMVGLEEVLLEEVYKNNLPVHVSDIGEVEDLKKFIQYGSMDAFLRNVSNFTAFTSFDSKTLLPEEYCDKLIECIKGNLFYQKEILEWLPGLIFGNSKILDFYIHSCPIILDTILDTINHQETLSHLYTDELYQKVKDYFAQKNNFSIDNLDKIETRFGPLIVRYMDNGVIGELARLQPEQLDKLLELFPRTEHTLSSMEGIYDSIKQYAFSREHPEVVQIFTDIMHSLADKDGAYIQKLENLFSVIDDDFYYKFGKKYPNLVEACKQDPREFLKQLVHSLENGKVEERTYATDVLHTITDYYISWEREKYKDTYRMVEDLNLPYDLDAKDIENQLMRHLFQFHNQITKNGESVQFSDVAITKLVEKGMELSLATDVVKYYAKVGNYTNDLDLVKSNIRHLIPVLKDIIHQLPENLKNEYTKRLDEENIIKRNYKVPSTEIDMYQILTTLRVDCLKDQLLSNENAYHSLLETMKKYKLHVFPPCFTNLLESENVRIPSDLNAISGFLSYYHQVYETERKRLESQGKDITNIRLTIPNILLNAAVLSGVSSVYNQFLGKEDAQIIKANSGPNSAIYKTANDERLKEAIDWTIKNFQRTEVTVPTFSENIKIDEKEMRVVVGNFTHPSNLTHGERTGACMRIGGVGETLFDFCLEDRNGFHIRFEDSETGEYISRVSGFRNGNTVFLNELRNSCNQKLYTNQNVVDACIETSKKLIEFSRESEAPIENVVVYNAYATEDMPVTNLNISNNKVGLKHFYSDIQGMGVILASTGTPFVPINFDKSHIPTYLPAREKIYAGKDKIKLMEMINRLNSVHKVLDGFRYEYVEALQFEGEFVYGMASQDWYIYVDSKGNVHEDLIPIDKRAEEELAIARKKIAEYVPEKETLENYQL